MTTIAYNKLLKIIGADSRLVDASDQVFMCNKIETLSEGSFFLGAGNCPAIARVRAWADTGFDDDSKASINELYDIPKEDNEASCIIISPDGLVVTLVDQDLNPMVVSDNIVAVGSGGPTARGALRAGATMERAIEIAIEYDGNSGGPVRTHTIVQGSSRKKTGKK